MWNKVLPLFYLTLAVIADTTATLFLPYTKEFTKILPSLGVLALYVVGLFFLTLSLRAIPIGIAYAIWAGMGIVFVAIFGYLFLKQHLDFFAIIGILFIIIGVVLINLFSKSINH